MLDMQKALAELRTKSMAEIERATALTWGGRAAASYHLAGKVRELPARLHHFHEGENYRQEALEHAAMAEDRGELLRAVHDELEPLRAAASARLDPAVPARGRRVPSTARGGVKPRGGAARRRAPSGPEAGRRPARPRGSPAP